MVSVPVATLAPPAQSVEWVQPAPLWSGNPAELRGEAFRRPRLLQFADDQFLPRFLDLLGGRATGDVVALDGTGGAPKLYQPLHGRYYLVAASLVCRRLGLPDREVARQNGERTTFVLRRRVAKGTREEGWTPAGGWQPLGDAAVLDGEERFPLHPVTVAACATPLASGAAHELRYRFGDGASDGAIADLFGLSPCAGRTIYYGYIPVDSREKWLERHLAPSGNPAADFQQYITDVKTASAKEGDYRFGEIESRVISTWRRFYLDDAAPGNQPANPAPDAEQARQASLYLLLDLGDFLQRNLPGVFNAIIQNSGSGLTGQRQALFNELNARLRVKRDGVATSLGAVLRELKPYLPLVSGLPPESGSPATPPHSYDLRTAEHRISDTPEQWEFVSANSAAYLARGGTFSNVTQGGPFFRLFKRAINEETAPPVVSDEIAGLLRDQVKVDVPGDERQTYFLRLIYEAGPCVQVISAPTNPFTFAKFFDPDAPARHIRIELPSPADLRKFKRGVGMEMPTELRNMMDRVNKGMLDGGGLGPTPGWELAMICSFSIPIITLVAFIVMFIFLIALNFIFWWLPFLKICFPIPRRSSP